MTAILIYGESGSGKSTSLRNINGKETILINALNKPLPFRGGRKKFGDNIVFTDNSITIVKKIHEAEKNKNIKLVIIDDFQAIMTNAYFSKIETKGYEKFTKIGKMIWDILTAAQNCRSDLKVVMMAHSETDTDGKVVCKTIGKLIKEKTSVEQTCVLVLYAVANGGKYTFLTQNDGSTIAKSPMGMFSDLEIDNDLAKVIKIFDEYFDEEDIEPLKLNTDELAATIKKTLTLDDLTFLFKTLPATDKTDDVIELFTLRKEALIAEDNEDVNM